MKVCDISGMGGREKGGYEWGCQVIRARALRFLERIPVESELPKHHSYENIIGILVSDNDCAKQMDDYVCAHPELSGMTGAMHQFGIMHATMWHKLGFKEYERKLREGKDGRKDEDFYEFDEAEAFPEDAGKDAK